MALLSVWACCPARAERVTVEFEAEASTVTGQPFGVTVPRLTVVRGYFTYETETADQKPADAMRGSFLLSGTWDFRAEFLDQVIKGSGTSVSTTNLFGHTLDFEDGNPARGSGTMFRNSLADADLRLGLSFTGEAKDLPTDQLPANFTFNPPPNGAFVTFVLSDTDGSLNLKFLSFKQVGLAIKSVRREGQVVEIVWSSVKGKRYALEFSTDLQNWTVLRNDLVGNALSTTVLDDLGARHAGQPQPERGFYRIVDRAFSP